MTNATFDLGPFRGMNAQCTDPIQAAVLLENSTISRHIYRLGTVDYVFFDEAVVLHEQTADYLYADFTPTDVRYTPGSRPYLEKIVKQVTAGLKTEREKALALLAWCRDIPTAYNRSAWGSFGGSPEPFHGGAEEEVIRKGSGMCNEQARVLAILAQIAGLPARYVGHMTLMDYDDNTSGTGHGVNEVYVEGSWAYMDIRGRYFLKDDGTFASAWEMRQDPELFHRQPDHVLAHRRVKSNHAAATKYHLPTSVTIIVNYFADDHLRYDYSWVYPSSSCALEARETGRAIRTTRHRDLLPQPRPRIV